MSRLFEANYSSLLNPFSQNNVLAISMIGGAPEIIAVIMGIILFLLALIIIYQLTYVIILKAIQTALMTAQYVFAPIFLVLLTNPVTDNIATNYIRTFVEVSLWNFIWIGLLKILVILLYSNINPWGKILIAIGILQIMMDAPQFLAHAKISVASDFVSPHTVVKTLKNISGYDDKIKEGIKVLRTALGTETEKHKQSPASKSTSNENNLNFANDNNQPNLTDIPPLKKTDNENNANNNKKENPQSQFAEQSPTHLNTKTSQAPLPMLLEQAVVQDQRTFQPVDQLPLCHHLII